MPDTDEATVSALFGGLAAGAFSIAVRVSELVEVVRVDTLVPVPSESPWVIGGLPLRGHVIPVVDLGRVMGGRDAVSALHSVAVVSDRQLTLGIACTGVKDVFESDRFDRAAAGREHGPSSVIAGFVTRAADDAAFAVIDVRALISAVPTATLARDGLRAPITDVMGASDAADRCVLVRSRGEALALPTSIVHSIVPFDVLAPASFAVGPCLGAIERDGRRIPAVDLLALCGAGRRVERSAGHAIVLGLDEGLVALCVDAVLDIAPVPRRETKPVQPPAGAQGWLIGHAFPGDALRRFRLATAAFEHERYLLLDPASLRAHRLLQGLAGLEAGSAASASETRGRTAARMATTARVLRYTAGAHFATPIEQVREILPAAATAVGCEPLRSILLSHGHAVTVTRVEDILGFEVAPGRRHVLVVDGPIGRVGFEVGALGAIEVVREELAVPAPSMSTARMRELCGTSCVVAEGEASRRALARLDLERLASTHAAARSTNRAA